MFTHKNLMTVCCAAVLAFGLAACGSSSSDDDKVPVTKTDVTDVTDVTAPTPEEMAAAVVAATKAAKTKLDAIGEIDATDGLGGAAETTGEGSYNLSIKRDRMATTVTVSVQDGATADPEEDEKFTQAMDLGGGLTMHTRDGEMGVQEIAMVMTDIAEPTATPFEEVDGQMLGVNPNGEGDFQSLAIGDSDDDDDNLGMVGGVVEFPSAPLQTAVPFDEDAEFEGNFNGASGKYTCDSTECTLSTDADGKLSAIDGTWYFTPDPGAESYVADSDFLSYGFWLKKTTTDGVVTYNEVAPFTKVDGMTMTTTTGAGEVTGSASYKGSAVGVYVHNVLTAGGGMVESRTAGHFTADASLMATFGQVNNDDEPPVGTIADNLLNTLTGTINKFMLAGGEDNDWSVALKGDINDTAAFVIENGTANGGGAPGSFTGQFYGAENETPGAVTGEFNANFSNGSVAGGFGVNKE